MPTRPHPFVVMAKPAGPRCNLHCAYCYYLEKERLYPATKKFLMSDAVLEAFVRQTIASQAALGAPEITFNWQGGEPTIAGLDFFRRAVALQRSAAPPGMRVENALQTNGTLLDEEWAAFLKEHDFLIGLSLDGAAAVHDRNRRDPAGRPTQARVLAALALLKAHDVKFNILAVVDREGARDGAATYRFLRDAGATHMQFIPLVERTAVAEAPASAPHVIGEDEEARVTPLSVTPGGYGAFLCDVFDAWIEGDVGRIFVQFFDVQLGQWLGGPASLCCYAETCGDGLALEHNGDVYACDHYVYPDYRLGNLLDTPLAELASRPEQLRFGAAKRTALPRRCRDCTFRFACNGGCPKHRFLKTEDGEGGLNYLCASHLRFFRHAGWALRTMADLAQKGLPPAQVMTLRRQALQASSNKKRT